MLSTSCCPGQQIVHNQILHFVRLYGIHGCTNLGGRLLGLLSESLQQLLPVSHLILLLLEFQQHFAKQKQRMVTNAERERGERSNCDGFQPVRVGPQSSAAGQLHSEPRPSGGETASVPAPSPTAETEPHPTTAATAEDRDDRH